MYILLIIKFEKIWYNLHIKQKVCGKIAITGFKENRVDIDAN